MIRHLPRVVPEAPGKPTRGDADHPMRKVTRQVAFEAGGWTGERKTKVETLFDDLAHEWHTRDHPQRHQPLVDAFERGGPITPGVCLELGSGTGMATPWLADRFSLVVASDLSTEMLKLAPSGVGSRIRADGSQLPLRDQSVDAAVLINMFLFPGEMDRVVRPEGALVWVNTSGDRTPIHLTADEVDTALPGEWDGVASEAGWGTWAVLRRA
jgi:SAM-dependent methyltransferase